MTLSVEFRNFGDNPVDKCVDNVVDKFRSTPLSTGYPHDIHKEEIEILFLTSVVIKLSTYPHRKLAFVKI